VFTRPWGAAVAWLLVGCLPIDESPLTEVVVTLRSSHELPRGATRESADGWAITLEHSVLGLHTLSLFRADGGGDPDSAVSGYARILSTFSPEPQRVALLFARGTCHFEYQLGRLPAAGRLQTPIVPGPSVSESDWTALSEAVQVFSVEAPSESPETDAYREVVGPDWFVQGRASNGDVEKRFRWLFWELSPERRAHCAVGELPTVSLSGREALTLELTARPETLFQVYLDDGDETLYFDELARLDADEDGWISQAELERLDDATSEHDSPYRRTVARLRQALTFVSSPVQCLPASER
jgi:hypothetical protein